LWAGDRYSPVAIRNIFGEESAEFGVEVSRVQGRQGGRESIIYLLYSKKNWIQRGVSCRADFRGARGGTQTDTAGKKEVEGKDWAFCGLPYSRCRMHGSEKKGQKGRCRETVEMRLSQVMNRICYGGHVIISLPMMRRCGEKGLACWR